MQTVSRKPELFNHASNRIMRAAGRAASSAGRDNLALRQAEKQFGKLVGEGGHHALNPNRYDRLAARTLSAAGVGASRFA